MNHRAIRTTDPIDEYGYTASQALRIREFTAFVVECMMWFLFGMAVGLWLVYSGDPAPVTEIEWSHR